MFYVIAFSFILFQIGWASRNNTLSVTQFHQGGATIVNYTNKWDKLQGWWGSLKGLPDYKKKIDKERLQFIFQF